MLKKVRFILVFISLSICLCLMSNTYSRYIADASGSIDVMFAKWQILVNNDDVTDGVNSTITFQPTIDPNEDVATGKIAPSSKGHFDIEIDPRNVDVSFKYDITLGIENENMPDLLITKYALVPEGYINGDPLTLVDIDNGAISNTLNFDNNTTDFEFAPFTVRVFFEWYEGVDEAMDDTEDTAAGNTAATESTSFNMTADISFEQVFGN